NLPESISPSPRAPLISLHIVSAEIANNISPLILSASILAVSVELAVQFASPNSASTNEFLENLDPCMPNRSEQFRKFETHLAWLFKIQFPKLSKRANAFIHQPQYENSPLRHPPQKSSPRTPPDL